MNIFRRQSTALTPPSPPKPSPNASQIFTISQAFAKFRNTTHPRDLSSGPPQTHPQLAEEGTSSKSRVPVEQADNFVCFGAVDVPKLLRLSRSSLLSRAVSLGANCLVDEHWRCTIRRIKSRQDDLFRVEIRYSASATRSTRSDPKKPVGMDQARSCTGLMTIMSRD